ncbi:MAG: glycosyltransferase [Candidatus Diapherotrites archaeon]|nr:glycosyltransferase [Candidatus Diapherotrites archaeon]MDZ4256190.1 glycosyltransferase [archaeon]
MIAELISIYGLLALTHLFVQINLSHAEYLRSLKSTFNPSFTPSVSIVIPTYNEDPQSLSNCVQSCMEQKYNGSIHIVVVNDGSKDPTGFLAVRKKFLWSPRVRFVHNPQNNGKRHAQKQAFDIIHLTSDAEILVTIDSDTQLLPDAVANLVQRFQDPQVGATTGHVKVVKTKKILSRIIDGRYWTAFNQERAAQSLFGTVLCCSGPLAAYRSSIIHDVKEKYISQVFLGEKCTYGDDRHLTNLILNKGYKVHYERRAVAFTHVPQTIQGFLKQQTRWNKSFYRELLWTIKMVIRHPRKLHPYIIYDMIIQLILPLLLVLSLGYTIYRSTLISPYYLLGYLAVLVGIALIRGMYGIYRTRDWGLTIFPVYALVHVFLLIPTRIYALLTMKNTHWGTR